MSYAEKSSITVTQGGSIRFAISSSISSNNVSKANKCRKSRPNVVLFDPRNIYGKGGRND